MPQTIEWLTDMGRVTSPPTPTAWPGRLASNREPLLSAARSPTACRSTIVLGPMADEVSPFVKTTKRDYVRVSPVPDVGPMHLEHILRQIEPNRDNLRHDRSPVWIVDRPTLAH